MQFFRERKYPNEKIAKNLPLAYFWVVRLWLNATKSDMRQVLIIGNGGFVRDMIACAVNRMGLSAVCVSDASQAEEDCRRGRFERVVVLGCSTFADGRVSVERLRPRGSRLPEIYVLSWHHSEHTVLSLLECGVNQYITFPVNLRRLCLKFGEVAGDVFGL